MFRSVRAFICMLVFLFSASTTLYQHQWVQVKLFSYKLYVLYIFFSANISSTHDRVTKRFKIQCEVRTDMLYQNHLNSGPTAICYTYRASKNSQFELGIRTRVILVVLFREPQRRIKFTTDYLGTTASPRTTVK